MAGFLSLDNQDDVRRQAHADLFADSFTALEQQAPARKPGFGDGVVNYADDPRQDMVPAFLRTRDLMLLDPDPDGSLTQKWGQAAGSNLARDYVAGLNVFGRPMTRDQLMSTEAGRQLLDIAYKNRRGERRGFAEAWGEIGAGDAPFVSLFATVAGSFADAKMVSDTMKKLQDGEPVTDDELVKTRLYMAKQERDAQGTWLATVGDITKALPGFAIEFAVTGGLYGAARAGAAKAVGVTTEAGTKLAVSTSVKKLGSELVEAELKRMAAKSTGKEATSIAVRDMVRGMTQRQQHDLARRLAVSLRPVLARDLEGTFGRKFVEGLDAHALRVMTRNIARTAVERNVSKLGAKYAFTRFATGLGQSLKDWTVQGLLDHGRFGTPTATVLFGKHNSAGKALTDALGTFLLEAPIRGSLQFGANYLATSSIAKAAGTDLVTDAQLSLEATALRTNDRRLMESASSIALGMSLMEYVSENTGKGFSSLFRGIGLATGISKTAARAFTGEVGGLLAEAKAAEAGGLIRRLVRKAMPSLEDTAERTSSARVAAVRGTLARAKVPVDEATAARIASGSVAGLSPEVARVVGDNPARFLRKAINDEARHNKDALYKGFARYWAADYMVRHQLSPDKLMNAFQRLGYDGIVEEMMEERYNDFAKGLLGWDEKGHATLSADALGQALRNIWVGPGGELDAAQLAAEAIGFSIPMLTRVASMHAMKSLGGPSQATRVRMAARASQEALRAMDVLETTPGDWIDSVNESIASIREEGEALKRERKDILDAAAANKITDEAELAKLTRDVDEKISDIQKRVDAQQEGAERVMRANGLDELASYDADHLKKFVFAKPGEEDRKTRFYAPVLPTSVVKGQLAEDKLRVDLSSSQLAQAVGAKAAAIEEAWRIGKAQYDALGHRRDWSAPWYSRWAQKVIGISAAVITGEPALAMRNYAGWAAADEGLDPRIASSLLELYKTVRGEHERAIRHERTPEAVADKAGARAPGASAEAADAARTDPSYAVSEEEIWEHMQDDYKARAAKVMENHFLVSGVRMFAVSDMKDQAALYLARKDGWTFDRERRVFERRESGESRTMSFEEFVNANPERVESLRRDIADATFRLMADNETLQRFSVHGVPIAVAHLPPGAPEAKRTAYALALEMSGFGTVITARELEEGQTLEDVAAAGVKQALAPFVSRIATDSRRADGGVDYDKPSPRDVIEVASILGYPVNTGSEEELAALRTRVVDVSRQLAGVVDLENTMSFSAEVSDPVSVRMYGRPAVTVVATRKSDGKWYATLVDTTGKGGSVPVSADTPEELRSKMEKRGFRQVDQGVAVTSVMQVVVRDPFLAVQQLGLARALLDRTLGGAEDADQRKTHPALRMVDGRYQYETADAWRAQVRAEKTAADMWTRFGDDYSQYPGEKPEEKVAARDRARETHDRMYGEGGYMTVVDQLLRDVGVQLPGASIVTRALGADGAYLIPVKTLRAQRKSAVQFVTVDTLYGQDDTSAILFAAADDAFSRYRSLIRTGGPFNWVVKDFLRTLDRIAVRKLASFDVTDKEARAIKALRDDVTKRWDSPTRRTFSEIVVAYPMFMSERDRATGLLSSRHSLAFQALAADIYQTPQFLYLFGLADLMFGGDGFSFEAAAKRFRADAKGFAPRGLERVLGLFHHDGAEYLENMVKGFKPLGMSYNDFVAAVNRRAVELNLKPRADVQQDAAGNAAGGGAAGLYRGLQQLFTQQGFRSLDDVVELFTKLAGTARYEAKEALIDQIRDLTRIKADFAREIQSREAEIQAQAAQIKELQTRLAELGATGEDMEAVRSQKEAAEQKLAQLRDAVKRARDFLVDLDAELAATGHGEGSPVRRTAEAARAALEAGDTPEKIPGDSGSGEARAPGEEFDPEGAEEGGFNLRLASEKLDFDSPAHLTTDLDGRVVVAKANPAEAELPEEVRAYAAVTVRNLAAIASGTARPLDRAEFDRLVLSYIPAIRDDELALLYPDYRKQAERARIDAMVTPAADTTDVDEDDEGINSGGDRGFGDKALAEYEGEQLKAFLAIAKIAAPETGKDLQAFLDLLRDTVSRQLAGVSAQGPLKTALEYLDRILNPRARVTADSEEDRALLKEIARVQREIVDLDMDEFAKRISAEDAELKVLAHDLEMARAQLSLAQSRNQADLVEGLSARVRELEGQMADAKARTERLTTKSRDELRKDNERLRKELSGLRARRAQLLDFTTRNALWVSEMNMLDDAGPDGRSHYDEVMAALMERGADGRPVNRKAALLLAFLKGLDRPARVRLLTLCANSARCSRVVADFRVDPETGRRDRAGGLTMKLRTGGNNALSSRTVVASFAELAQMSLADMESLCAKLRASAKASAPWLPGRARSLKGSIERRNRAIAAMQGCSDILAEVFGSENVFVQVLRAPYLKDYLREAAEFASSEGQTAYIRSIEDSIIDAATTERRGEGVPALVQGVLDFVEEYRRTVKDGDPRVVRVNALERLSLAWFSYGMSAASASEHAEGVTMGHKTAFVGTAWAQVLELFRSATPRTIDAAEFVEGRSEKTSSKVVISSRGVIPIVAQWMDKPITDETGFAYIAKNFMGGETGKRLRAMSDEEFLETVLPVCRQTMTWPNAEHTPILAKNLTRDYSPNAVRAACGAQFADSVHGFGQSTVPAPKEMGRLVRWYVPLFSGEHTSGAILQLPGLVGSETDELGNPRYVSWLKEGATYDEASTAVCRAVGLDRLGRDTKRSFVSCAEVPGIALRGCVMRNGVPQFGESRVHALVSFDAAMAPARNEALAGTIVATGFAVREQRKVAADPRSHTLKLHYVGTSGEDITLDKGLTCAVDEEGGLYDEDEVVGVLQRHLLAFQKGRGDGDRSTDIMMDRDGLKVGILNSSVTQVVLPDGSATTLLDYIADRLRGVDVPDGGLDAAALGQYLADGAGSPGTFTWREPDGAGGMRDVRRTAAELLPGLVVSKVEGLNGAAIDVCYVDNGLMSYTVANVSHEARPEVGRAPRNLMIDASTMSVAQARYMKDRLTGERLQSAKRVMDCVANWGVLTSATTTDETTIEDCRTGLSQSDALRVLIDVEGEDPRSPLVEDQLAYDVLKRTTRSLNLPLNKLDCALATGGAVYDDATGEVICHAKDPFFRYCAKGSRVYSKEEAKWRGTSRSLGFARINVHSDTFRIGWHLDRDAFAKAYARPAREASEGVPADPGLSEDAIRAMTARELGEMVEAALVDIRAADRRHAEALADYRAYVRSAAATSLVAAKRDALKASLDAARTRARDLRKRFASGFVDHYGQRISELRCHYEGDSAGLYCHSVCFEDLFIAGERPGQRVFDRSALCFAHESDEGRRAESVKALRLGGKAAGGLAHMASDGDPLLLAGTAFGFPRTPSYNGSMWGQALRAVAYAQPDVHEDDGSVWAGYDAAVIPDAQSLKILGCDHDGDKSQCYMYYADPETGVADQVDQAVWDDVFTFDSPAALMGFARDRARRRQFLDKCIRAGLVARPTARRTGANGESEGGYRVTGAARRRISNGFVQGVLDMTRNTVEEQPDEERDFYGTRLARATKARPIANESMWKELVDAAGDARRFLKDRMLVDTDAAAKAATSARATDRARAQVVSLAGLLHIAQMSGRFDEMFSRSGVASDLAGWFDFIYGLDGISNATFDDIKNQICARLGWTPGMMDTLVVDLMMTGERAPRTDGEFFDILLQYVKDIAGHGSRYYMMAASEPPEGDREFTLVHRRVRGMYKGWDKARIDRAMAGDGRAEMREKLRVDDVVTRDSVMDFFGIVASPDGRGGRAYRFREGAAKTQEARELVSSLRALAAQVPGQERPRWSEHDVCSALVTYAAKRGGESAGAGYVCWLVQESDRSYDVAEAFMRWARGMDTLSQLREYAAAVNYTKADPGDPTKLGRREASDKAYGKLMQNAAGVDIDVDVSLAKMHEATSAIYRVADLATSAGRVALAANNRGAALARIADSALRAARSPALGRLVTTLYASPGLSAYDLLTLQANLQSIPYTLAALRTMPDPRQGTALFGDRATTWSTLDVLADAADAVDKPSDQGPLGRSMALRRAMESLFSVLYTLVAGSHEGVMTNRGLACFTLHRDSKYGGSFSAKSEVDEFGMPVVAESAPVSEYLGARDSSGSSRVRRLACAYQFGDEHIRGIAVEEVQALIDGVLDSDSRVGRSRTPQFPKETYARGFALTLENLQNLRAEYGASADPELEKSRTKREFATDLKIAIVFLNKLAAARGVDASTLAIEPSTIMSQLVPLLACMTTRAGAANSVLRLMPDARRRLSKEVVRLFSGELERSARPDPGFSLLDVVIATALGPAHRTRLNDVLAVVKSGNLTAEDQELAIGQLLVDKTEGNEILETPAAVAMSKKAAGVGDSASAPSARNRRAPDYRNMVDILAPDNVIRDLHEYSDEALSPVVELPEPAPTPEEAAAEASADDTKVSDAPPTDEARRLVSVVNAALPWARASLAGGGVIKIRSRQGLRGSAARRFASEGVDVVLTVRVGEAAAPIDVSRLDVNSPAVAASFCEAARMLGLTADQFMRNLTQVERKALLDALVSGKSQPSFALGLPSAVRVSGRDMAILAGEIQLGSADSDSLYHELFHAMTGMFRMMDVFGEEDVAALRRQFGDPPKGTGWLFNEERAANAFRKYARQFAHKSRADYADFKSVSKEDASAVRKVFDRLLTLLRAFINALVKGFSYRDREASSYLFDMYLTGYAVMSSDKLADVDKAASDEVAVGEFRRLLERETDVFKAGEAPAERAAGVAQRSAERRRARALQGVTADELLTPEELASIGQAVTRPDPFAGGDTPVIRSLSGLLMRELRSPRPRVSALRAILSGLVGMREARAAAPAEVADATLADALAWQLGEGGQAPEESEESRDADFRAAVELADAEENRVNDEVARAMSEAARLDALRPGGPALPEVSLGRAAVRHLLGAACPEDLALLRTQYSRKTWSELVMADTRLRESTRRARLARVRRREGAMHQAVAQFLRAEDTPETKGRRAKLGKREQKLFDQKRNQAANDAYMALMAASGWIAAHTRRANTQRGDIHAPDGTSIRRGPARVTSAQYAGFLMAASTHGASHYLDALHRRLVDVRDRNTRDGVGNRVSAAASFLLEQLSRFDEFDDASMVTRGREWADAVNAFEREVMSGVRRGGFDSAANDFAPYSHATDADPLEAGETADLRARNQGIYQFATPGFDKADDPVQSMLRDVEGTLFAVTASANFAREFGLPSSTPLVDVEFFAKNPPPVDLVDAAAEFRLARGDVAGVDARIIDRQCEPSFVLANVDKWFEGSLPLRAGNMELRDLFMKSSAAMRGMISQAVNTLNFWANYLGYSRADGRRLLKLREHKGKFRMEDGFYRRVDSGTYIGFDVYHGVNGVTTGVEFTEDDYRVVDQFLKALAVLANGGRYVVTGAAGFQFGSLMKPSDFETAVSALSPNGARIRDLKREDLERFLQEADTDRYDPKHPPKAISPVMMALWKFSRLMPRTLTDGPGREASGTFFGDYVSAVKAALEFAHGERRKALEKDMRLMPEDEFNDLVLGELERRGVAVAVRDGRTGRRVSGAFAVAADRLVDAFRGSEAVRKLREAGRGRHRVTGEDGKEAEVDFLDPDYIMKDMMRGYHELRREALRHPWLTEGDARFLNGFSTPLPFYQGTGMFMYHAIRSSRDVQASAEVRLGKHEAVFLNMCESEANQSKGLDELTLAQCAMIHDYFGTKEAGEALRTAILEGGYAPGTRKAVDTGFSADPASTTFLGVARQIYLKQQERLLRVAEGRPMDPDDDAASLRRMVQTFEDMTSAGGATLVGNVGMTDEQMYRMHGVLPANMQIGHKILAAMKGIADSLYRRSVLVNMMFTKTVDGRPVYYINPTKYGVEAGGVPDEVWAAMARWWTAVHPDLVYDNARSGIENARAMFATLTSMMHGDKGELGGRRYESMKKSDLFGQKSVDDVLCAVDDPFEESTSRMNALGRTGEALGYAKHFFLTDRAPAGARLQWLDRMMAWSKSLSVFGSAFFPIATKWESHVAAVGALATLGSNLSPEFTRKHHAAMRRLQSLFSFGHGWIGEDFIGFRDIVEMMDTNDPFLADIVMWAESMGITMSTTLNNPMEPTKGYVQRDIRKWQEKLRKMGFASETVGKVGGLLEAMFLRSGEKAFTYALNATKLAVTCQMAMKLREEARRAGRAFDPIRDLGKYAAYIDTEVGGINPLRYAWMHPQMQTAMNRLFFSWQWTRSAWEAGGGHFLEDLLFGGHTINKETRRYAVGRWLRMFGTIMIGVPMMMQALIKALALAAGRDDDDDKWFTWQNEDKTKWTAYDLTPLMKVVHEHEPVARLVGGIAGGLFGRFSSGGGTGRMIAGAIAGATLTPDYTGGDPANALTRNRRYYGHFGKQGWEFFHWFDKPFRQAMSKLSMPIQRLLEGVTGRNMAYLDRELPLTNASIAERFLTIGSRSAWTNFLGAFMPFSVGSWLTFGDAGFMSYFGPVQMGTSVTNTTKRLEEALEKWATNERTAYAFGAGMRKRSGKAMRRGLVADVLQDAARNGVALPEALVVSAIGKITPRLYSKLDRQLTDGEDEKEIRRTCRALLKLGSTYDNAMQSLKKRRAERGAALERMPKAELLALKGAVRSGFRNPMGY